MVIVVFVVSVLLIGIDQLTKYLVLQNVAPIGGGMVTDIPLINGFLDITYLENPGAALGLLQNQRWIFIPLTIIGMLILIIALFKYKNHNIWSYMAIALLIAGGIGNLIDRVAFGYVVDFIKISFFPYIFNIADCCVTIGAVLLIPAIMLSGSKKEEDKLPEPPELEEKL